jgi:serine kinase of HPr protein (carbohydrate metabolism regulator)
VRAHNATCVALGGRGVLIEGPPGSGKSALALALIDRGAQLVGDDGVLLIADGGKLLARPHPQTRGLLEIRNLGLVRFEAHDQVDVALLVTFDAAAPRFIEEAGQAVREGVKIPHVTIWSEPAAPALKVEQALRLYGLAASTTPRDNG